MPSDQHALHKIVQIVAIVCGAVVAAIFLKIALRPPLVDLGLSAARARWIGDIAVNAGGVGLALWLIRRRQLSALAGVGPGRLANARLLAVPGLIAALLAANVLDVSFGDISGVDLGLLALWCLSIGWFEEAMLRGVLQSALVDALRPHRRAALLSVVVSSVVFGLLHLVVWTGGFWFELGQLATATSLGVLFGAILLRTGRLYPIALLHASLDFFSAVDELKPGAAEGPVSSTPDELGVCVLLLPFLAFGLWQCWLVDRDWSRGNSS